MTERPPNNLYHPIETVPINGPSQTGGRFTEGEPHTKDDLDSRAADEITPMPSAGMVISVKPLPHSIKPPKKTGGATYPKPPYQAASSAVVTGVSLGDFYDSLNRKQATNSNRIDSIPNSTTNLDSYSMLRQDWLEAKKQHEQKQVEYLAAVDAFYKNWVEEVNGKDFFDRNWTKLRTKFGLKPELPAEIAALRGEADAASETYGQYAREMTEKRGLAGKKTRAEISPEVLDQYNRRFGREIVVNTLKRQTESQAKAVESLGFESNKFVSYLSKNKTMIKLLGAGALGAATGGLAGVVAGGAWWARSTAGGAAAAGVAGITNKKWSESIKNWTEAQQEAEVRSLAAKINDKALSKEEIAEYRGKLEAILAQADEKNRTKMFAIIGLAAVTGAVVGGGVAAAAEEFFGIGTAVGTEVGVDSVAPTEPQNIFDQRDAIVDRAEERLSQETAASGNGGTPQLDVAERSAGAETASPAEAPRSPHTPVVNESPTVAERGNGGTIPESNNLSAEAEQVVSRDEATIPVAEPVATPPAAGVYEVQTEDTVWDILEGQTDAGKFTALEPLTEAQRQQVIAAVVARLNESAELREQLALGDTADMLYAGRDIDTDILTTLIQEEVAKLEDVPEAATPVAEAPTVPEAVVPAADTALSGESERASAETTAPAVAPDITTPSPEHEGTVINANSDFIRQYAMDFPGGYQMFEASLNRDFIEEIQGPDPTPGFIERLFGAVANKNNAYIQLADYRIGQIQELAAAGNETQCAVFLDEHAITPNDFNLWNDAITAWRDTGLVSFGPETRFDDAVKAAYIAQISNPTHIA